MPFSLYQLMLHGNQFCATTLLIGFAFASKAQLANKCFLTYALSKLIIHTANRHRNQYQVQQGLQYAIHTTTDMQEE